MFYVSIIYNCYYHSAKNVDKLFWFAPKHTLCTDMTIRVQWFSQLDGIHQQKDAKWYSLKSLLKKFFNWLSHFLRICIISKNTHICTPWPPNFFLSFLTYDNQKNAEFYADFKSVEIIWKKCTLKKLFDKNLYKLVV